MSDAFEKPWRATLQPPDRRPIYESLAEDLVLGAESPYQGPFSIHNSPWIKEPLDALAQPETRRVLVSGAAQLSKTLLGLIFVIWCILRRPGLTTWNCQTDNAVKKIAEDKAWPLFNRCRSLKRLLPAEKNKTRIRSIVFPHMAFRMQSASENNAHSDTVKNQINDERHLWGPGLIFKFLSRVGSMPDHKVLDLSTGSSKTGEEQLADGTTIEVGDDFFNDCRDATNEVWHVCCPSCKRLQPLAWKHRQPDGKELLDGQGRGIYGIVWDENEVTRPKGRWNFPELEKTARWKCQADALGLPGERCEFELPETCDNIKALNSLASGARYVALNPLAGKKTRSFRFPAMVSELVGWGPLVHEWIKANETAKAGDYKPLKTFIQNRLGEAWDESVTLVSQSVASGDYRLGDPWNDDDGNPRCSRRIIAVDVQEKNGRHYWVLCRDWAENGDSRLVSFQKAYTWDEIRALQGELGVPDNRVVVDAADGNNTREIYETCCKYGWLAFQGVDSDGFPHFIRQGGKPVMKAYSKPTLRDPSLGVKKSKRIKQAHAAMAGAKRFATLIRWSNPTVKDILARLISGTYKYFGRPSNEPREYTEQLNSEIKKTVKTKNGRQRLMWTQVKTDNHARDLEAMQVVCALIAGFLTPETEQPEKDEDTKAAEELKAAAPKVREYALDESKRFQKRTR